MFVNICFICFIYIYVKRSNETKYGFTFILVILLTSP